MNLIGHKQYPLINGDIAEYLFSPFNGTIDKVNTNPNRFYSTKDFHIHTIASQDGGQSISDIFDRIGRIQSISPTDDPFQIGITDHNNMIAVEYLAKETNTGAKEGIIICDGIPVAGGVEEASDFNPGNGYHMSMHTCLFGIDRDPKNDIMQIISNKNFYYTKSMNSYIEHLSAKDPIYKTSIYDFRCFIRDYDDRIKYSGFVTDKIVIDYFKSRGIDESQIKNDLRDFDQTKYKDNYYIDIRTLSKATHRAGGLVIIPHFIDTCDKFITKNNLNITLSDFAIMTAQKLLQIGVDGFEVINYKNRNLLDSQIFNKFISNYEYFDASGNLRKPILSCGVDVHYILDTLQRDIALYDVRAKDYIEQVNLMEVLQENERAKRLQIKNDRIKNYEILEKRPQSTFIDMTPYMQVSSKSGKPSYNNIQKTYRKSNYQPQYRGGRHTRNSHDYSK